MIINNTINNIATLHSTALLTLILQQQPNTAMELLNNDSNKECSVLCRFTLHGRNKMLPQELVESTTRIIYYETLTTLKWLFTMAIYRNIPLNTESNGMKQQVGKSWKYITYLAGQMGGLYWQYMSFNNKWINWTYMWAYFAGHRFGKELAIHGGILGIRIKYQIEYQIY